MSSPGKASERQSVFTLVNAVLGAGVLGYPFCYKVCGLGLATLLVLITLSASELSMRLLMVASQLADKRSYEDLAAHCFGGAGRSAVRACVTVLNLGSLVAYLNILADMFSLVANTVIPPGAEPSRNALLAAITLGAALPVALFVKSPRLLSSVSQASVAFIFFFSLVIGLMALSHPMPGRMAVWEPGGVLVAFPVIVYSFTAHQVIFSIYSSLRSATVTRMTSVIQKSMLLSTIVYLIVGLCGYVAFGNKTAGDVLRNFGGPSTTGPRLALERLLKIGYGVSILGTVPLIVLPLQAPFASVVGLKNEPGAAYANPFREHIVTALVIGSALALAILVPNIEYVFGLCGSTVSVIISFILPASIYLKVASAQRGGPTRDRRRTAAALLLFGVLSGGACTQAMLRAVTEEAEVVQLAQELLREETKVLKAAEAQKKVKQMAEAVGAVAEAQRQLNEAQAEAHLTLGVVQLAANDLNTTATGQESAWEQLTKRTKGVGEVKKDLQLGRERVDSAVQRLENATATLGAAASKLRVNAAAAGGGGSDGAAAANVTAGAAAGGGGSGSGSGGGKGGDSGGAMGQQESAEAGAAGKSSGGSSRGSSGDSTAANAEQTAAQFEAVAAAAAGDRRQQGQEEGLVAQALDAVANATNITLSRVRESQLALEAAHEATGKWGHKREDILTALNHATNKTVEAAAQMNATVERLKQVEADKRSELVGVAAALLKDQEEEEAKEAREKELAAILELREGGRKEGAGWEEASDGSGGGSGEGGSKDAAGGGAEGGSSGGGGSPESEERKKKNRDSIKLAATNGTSAMNVTEIVEEVGVLAETAAQAARANLAQAMEKKKSEVATRAIEIAKELAQATAVAAR